MKFDLNFDWQFVNNYNQEYINKFPENFEMVDLPHCIRRIPSTNFVEDIYKATVTYRKFFNLESFNDKNQYVFIDFYGFMNQAEIYLNGKSVGKYFSMWRKVSVDITKYVKQKDNELIVVVDSNEDLRYPPFGGQMKYLNFAGLYKRVTIRVVPKIYIEKSLVNASMEGRVSIKDIVKGETNEKYSVKHEIYRKGQQIAFSSISAFIIDFPQLWSPKSPNLYSLKTTVSSRFGEDSYETKFGFRDIRVDFDGIYINNEIYKFVGINRLESFPYVGLAMPKSGQQNDADLIKNKIGANIVRCINFPANEDFLARCDEIGLLVISEPPSSGGYVSGNDQWRNQHIENVREKILEEYNHPCVIANSVRIDGAREDRELFEESDTAAKSIDTTRPTFGALKKFKGSYVTDIVGFNDYALRNYRSRFTNPFLMIGNMKPTFISDYTGEYDICKLTDDFNAKKAHALHHLKALNDVNRNKGLLASFASAFSDYYVPYSLSSGDNIFYSGVLDIFRSKKPAAEAYYSQQDEKPMIKVLSTLKPYDSINQALGKIIVLTNGDYVELYKDDAFVKRFYPNLSGYNDLKHPPIVVDDLLGKSLCDPRFNEKENALLAKLFSKMAIYGERSLSLADRIILGRLGNKYHITSRGLKHLFNRYLGPSVIEQSTFAFRVYKNDEWVTTETFAPPKTFDLSLDVQKNQLVNGPTFDVSRIHIKYVDQNNHVMETANFGLHIDLEGPISLLSEKEIVTLKAGQCSIWVRSHKKLGDAKVKISVEGIEKIVEFKIKNKKGRIEL